MNRRDFLFGRIGADRGLPSAMSEKDERENRDRLFRAAMAAGIDPATMDPERLYELFNHEEGSARTPDSLKT